MPLLDRLLRTEICDLGAIAGLMTPRSQISNATAASHPTHGADR